MLVEPMLLLEPSALGFTISGYFMSCVMRSRADSISWNFGVRMSCWSSTFLPSALSSAMASVAKSSRVRNAEQLAQHRHLGLAITAFDTFRDVEDEVDVSFREHAGQIGRRLEVHDDVTLARGRVSDCDDRLRRITRLRHRRPSSA